MKLYYDLHMHSCLSPCGSSDMTPANLAAMCALAGLEVARLVRVREGPLELGSLPGGRWRRLTEEELTAVYRSSGRKTPE